MSERLVWPLLLLLAGCEVSRFSPYDSGSPEIDAGHADASAGRELRFSMGGSLSERGTTRSLEGAEICAEGLTCVRTDHLGRWRLDAISAGEPVLVTATHAGYLPSLSLFEPTMSRTNLAFSMWDPARLDALIESLSSPPRDPTQGGTSLAIARGLNFLESGVEGVEVTLSVGAVGPIYPEPDEIGGFRVGATSSAGSAAWYNVPPGDHELTITAPGRRCTSGLRWVGPAPDRFPVPVRAGVLTELFFVCPELAAVGAGCSDEVVCDGSTPACLVGPEGPVCVDRVGACPARPACVDGVLLNRCVHGQARGYQCASIGARCDAAASACLDVPEGSPCGTGRLCASGLACVEGRCAEGTPCAAALECVAACPDATCSASCGDAMSADSRALLSFLEACSGAAGCASAAVCQAACPVEHNACVSDR